MTGATTGMPDAFSLYSAASLCFCVLPSVSILPKTLKARDDSLLQLAATKTAQQFTLPQRCGSKNYRGGDLPAVLRLKKSSGIALADG
jgi:hypothetical protein